MESVTSTSSDRVGEDPRMFEQRSQAAQFLDRFVHNAAGVIGLTAVAVILVLSIGAPLFTSVDPADMDSSSLLAPPSAEHPFGTDDLGRDVFSRVLYGGRISILVGVVVAGVTGVMGTLFGVLAGYHAKLDSPIMRTMDIVMAFPPILLALGVVAILGPQLANVMIALIIPYTPRTARVVRGMILQLKGKEFVEAAKSLGVGDLRIMTRHLLPNSLAPLLVQQTYILALAILAEAALSFLGVGVPPSVPTLGGIISDARAHLRYAPLLAVYPGIVISILVLGFNLLGDGLRDVLDPRMKM